MKNSEPWVWAFVGLVGLTACGGSNPNMVPDDPIMVRAHEKDEVRLAAAERLRKLLAQP